MAAGLLVFVTAVGMLILLYRDLAKRRHRRKHRNKRSSSASSGAERDGCSSDGGCDGGD